MWCFRNSAPAIRPTTFWKPFPTTMTDMLRQLLSRTLPTRPGRRAAVLTTVLTGILLAATACSSGDYEKDVRNPELLHESVWKMTDVMVHDIFSPPQAARAYAYASVAAYESLVPAHDGYQSLSGQLNALRPAPSPPGTPGTDYLPSIAAVHAFNVVATDKVFTQSRMEKFHENLHARYRKMGVPSDLLDASTDYGDAIAEHVLAWAAEDGYRQTRSAPSYTVTDEPGRWQPTPPAYLDAIEPAWAKHRPFVMKDGDQFKPKRPDPFSLEKDSEFWEELMEVYRAVKNASEEEREIAAFWDCNPYVMHTQGHAMFATKAMSPGGHWMGIAIIANRKTDAGLMRSAEVLAQTSVALADGFISAWDEKYRSNLVRPETVINEHVDEDWRPVLQTPPFPEYTSAHSVISAAAAVTLTDLYGDDFAFKDTTEVAYGLEPRSFDSFLDAANEAAISRVYGGIHYPMAAEVGKTQGKNVGQWVIDRVETRPAPIADGTPPERNLGEAIQAAGRDGSTETSGEDLRSARTQK
jgi:hypothetical protein